MIDVKHTSPKKNLQAFKHLMKHNPDQALNLTHDFLPTLRYTVNTQSQDFSIRDILNEWWSLIPSLHTGPVILFPKSDSFDTDENLWIEFNRISAFLKDTLIESQWKNQTKGKFGGPKPVNLSWKAFYLEQELLLSECTNLEEQLAWAAENGHEKFLKRLLEKSPELTSRLDKIAWPKIIIKNFQSIFSYLIDLGFSVNATSQLDWTPLHWAIYFLKDPFIKTLVQHDANPNALNTHQQSPLFFAAFKGSPSVVNMLIKYNGNKYSEDFKGFSPLSASVYQGHIQTTALLLDGYSEPLPKPVQPFGWDLLHIAAIKGFSEIASLLIKAGADVECTDNFGRTPLHWACQFGHAPIVHSLIDSGVFLNTEDKFGDTPLKVAALTGNQRLTHWIFQQGGR